MPVNLSLDPNLALVAFEYNCDVTLEDIVQARKQLYASLDVQPYNKQLDFYHTDVEVKWSLDDFFHYRSKLGKLTGYLSKMRVAVVTDSSLIFGFHRMYEVENKIMHVYSDHMTFYTLGKACDWLNIPRDIIQERF
jgi:hypothetical protein